jgi:hypothetical protein
MNFTERWKHCTLIGEILVHRRGSLRNLYFYFQNHTMKKTTRFLIVTIFAFLSVRAGAQDRYDFTIIAYFPAAKILTVADGNTTVKEDVDVDKNERITGNALLKKVREYNDKGWEVITFANAAAAAGTQEFYAYLRKKRAN